MTDMHAVIRRLHSPDIDDLEGYQPSEPDRFSFLLQILAGPENGEGEESFDVVVCTPRWILENHSRDDIVLGRHMMIVFRYDYHNLRDFLTKKVAQISGETWNDVAQGLSRVGRWEFEDYVAV
jgi:hypothetical protein